MNVEDTVARRALEVMVVMVIGTFEPWAFAWKIHQAQLTVFQQGRQAPIERRKSKARHLLWCCLQCLLGKQRMSRPHDCVSYRETLTCIAFHASRVSGPPPYHAAGLATSQSSLSEPAGQARSHLAGSHLRHAAVQWTSACALLEIPHAKINKIKHLQRIRPLPSVLVS
jgi:hypothetical protein